MGLTMVTHFGVILAMQGWMAMVYLGGALPDREFITRLLAAFMGFGMAVRGNFFAKLPAPSSDTLGVWTRTSRHTALVLVLTGLALAGCAAALPMPGVLMALGGALLLILMLTHVQRRATAALEAPRL